MNNQRDLKGIMNSIRNDKQLAIKKSAATRGLLTKSLEAAELNRQLFHVNNVIAEKLSDCYLLPSDNENELFFIDADLAAAMLVKVCLIDDDLKKFIKEPVYIFATAIISFKNGNGHKMVKKLMEAADSCNKHIVAWVETPRLARHWERYGGKNYGKLGGNKEWLFIRKPHASRPSRLT